jgi:uncharacterized RDD family membrane protein YckC
MMHPEITGAASAAAATRSMGGATERDTHSPLAAPARRIVAHLFDDMSVLLPLCLALSSLVMRDGALALVAFAAGSAVLAGLVAINLAMLGHHGQSIGKRLLGLRIVRMDGRRIGLARVVALRTLLPCAASFVPFAGVPFVLANVALLFGPSRRTLHDRLAGSMVIRVRRADGC